MHELLQLLEYFSGGAHTTASMTRRLSFAVASALLLNFLPHSIPTGAEDFLQSFGPTFSTYLNQTVGAVFPGVGFVVVPLTFEDAWPAVSEATVDFLFLNPSSAGCMERQDTSCGA